MPAIVGIGENPNEDGNIQVNKWVGFEPDENACEPLKNIWEDAPQFVSQTCVRWD